MNIRKKVLVEVSKLRVFAQLYISRDKNAPDLDETLPKRTATSTLVDQKARLKDVVSKRRKSGAGSSLLIVWSGGRAVVAPLFWAFDRDSWPWYDSTASKVRHDRRQALQL